MINPLEYIKEESWYQVELPRSELRAFMKKSDLRGSIKPLLWIIFLFVSAMIAVACPKHNAKFDLKTGEALTRPAREPLGTFPVKVKRGHLYIGLKTS